MRIIAYTALLALIVVCDMRADTISLKNGANLVSFNDTSQVIKLGEDCSTGACLYGGSQSLPGNGTLTWQFSTPDTKKNIVWDLAGGIAGPTGGVFTASDGSDGIVGTYTLSSWADDGTPDDSGFDGVDLYGQITVTGMTLNGAATDPHQHAFEKFLSLPDVTSYSFDLDVTNCKTDGALVPCMATPDPSAKFDSLGLTPDPVPEPGTVGLLTVGLLTVFGVRRRMKNAAYSNERDANLRA